MGALESVTLISLEEISRVKDLQLGAGGAEENVILCNVRPRVDILVKEKSTLVLFALDSSEMGRTEVVEHCIDTLSHSPIRQAPCRMPFPLHSRDVGPGNFKRV